MNLCIIHHQHAVAWHICSHVKEERAEVECVGFALNNTILCPLVERCNDVLGIDNAGVAHGVNCIESLFFGITSRVALRPLTALPLYFYMANMKAKLVYVDDNSTMIYHQ